MKSCAKIDEDQWLLEDTIQWVKTTYGTEQHKRYSVPIVDVCMIAACTIIHATGDYKLATAACLNECLVGQDRKKHTAGSLTERFGGTIVLLMVNNVNTFLINSIITKHIINKGLTEEEKSRYNDIVKCLDNCPSELMRRCREILK